MNEQKFSEFSEYLAKNKNGLEKVKELGNDYAALAEYARELGYDLSPDEIKHFLAGTQKEIESKWSNLDSEQTLSDGAKQFMAFSKLADADAETAKQIAELSKNPQDLIAYGKEKGFDFDEKDIKEVAKELMEQEEELSDEELESVAGGVTLFLAVAIIAGVVAVSAGVGAAVTTAAVCGVAAAVMLSGD